MGKSFYAPAASNEIEAYPAEFYHAPSDTHFSMTIRSGEYIQRRWQIGLGGKEINVEELRVDFVMGSGNHARSYLHRTDQGTLVELPLGWFPEGGGHWAMSPGSDSDHPRARRFVSYKCMFCHNAVPDIPKDHEAPGSDPVFAGRLPEGIDCQRCHGPGARHVKTVQTRGSTRADLLASIVNPARLSPKLRMEVCMQCHLETTSGRIPAEVVRFDRGPFSFVPGQPLGAFMLTFDHARGSGHEDKFEAVSSVYRLRQSQCFLQSQGAMTCETCHNPHKIPRGAEAASAYSAACLSCHGKESSFTAALASGAHTAATDCRPCHMPRRRAEDTPGMVMTDHLIQRRPPAKDLLAVSRERPPEEYRGEVVPYYPSPLPPTPDNALYRAVAQVGMGNNAAAGLPVLAREIARQKPREAEFYVVLGDGRMGAGKPTEAVAAYENALRLSPLSMSALRALAAAFVAAGEPERAAAIFRKAPGDAISWYRYGLLDFGAGRYAEALEKIRRALALDSSLPDQSRSLAEVLMKLGRTDAALSALDDALRTDPWDDAAWDLRARLMTERNEPAEASFDFEKAIALSRGQASYLFDYALALVRSNRFADAQVRAEAAVKADPKLPEAHQLLGGIYESTQRPTEAAREYTRAIELRPSLGQAQLRLGLLLRSQGDSAGGRQHLREAAKSADPAVARQAAAALQ